MSEQVEPFFRLRIDLPDDPDESPLEAVARQFKDLDAAYRLAYHLTVGRILVTESSANPALGTELRRFAGPYGQPLAPGRYRANLSDPSPLVQRFLVDRGVLQPDLRIPEPRISSVTLNSPLTVELARTAHDMRTWGTTATVLYVMLKMGPEKAERWLQVPLNVVASYARAFHDLFDFRRRTERLIGDEAVPAIVDDHGNDLSSQVPAMPQEIDTVDTVQTLGDYRPIEGIGEFESNELPAVPDEDPLQDALPDNDWLRRVAREGNEDDDPFEPVDLGERSDEFELPRPDLDDDFDLE